MKKNNWILIAGGAVLLWWLMRKNKKGALPIMKIPFGGPRRQKINAQVKEAVQDLQFVPDETTDKQMYVDSQKQCK